MEGSGDGVLLVGHCSGCSRCAGAAAAASGTTIAAEVEIGVAPLRSYNLSILQQNLPQVSSETPLFDSQPLFLVLLPKSPGEGNVLLHYFTYEL